MSLRAFIKMLKFLPPHPLYQNHEMVFKRWEESRTTAEGPQKDLPKHLPYSKLLGQGSPPFLTHQTAPGEEGAWGRQCPGTQERSRIWASAGVGHLDTGIYGERLASAGHLCRPHGSGGLKPHRESG